MRVTDDDTTVWNPWEISFPGTSVTDNGNGTVSIDLPGLATALCTQAQMNCFYTSLADCPDTDKCFVYEDSVLVVYVNNDGQWQWPETAVFDKVLMETGDYVLMETGDKILLE